MRTHGTTERRNAVGRGFRAARIGGAAIVAALAVACIGCKAMAAPWLMWAPEPTRSIPAEYPYLEDKKVCILVWADRDTLFEYPFVQLELSEHVAAPLRTNVRGISVLPNRGVVEMQRRDPDWDRIPPGRLGARLGADRVIMIELTLYTTREPESTHLYRGHIAANIKVYDTGYPDSPPAFRTNLETAYPPDSPGQWGADDRAIRKAAMEAFADDLARKFYSHKVKVQ